VLLVLPLSSAQSPCTVDPANACKFSCGGGKSFDLTAFGAVQAPNGYFTVDDAADHTYYVAVCNALTSLSCKSESGMAAIQTWNHPVPSSSGVLPYYECENAGSWHSQACTELDGVLACLFTGGDDQRSVQIIYQCGSSPPVFAAVDDGSTPPAYVVTVSSSDTCTASPAAADAGGLSGGGLFLILFFVAVITYIGGGLYYNIKYREMPQTIESFPHIKYWRELPGLVKDGCKFSWKQTKIAAKEAEAWYNGTKPELSKGLTAVDEGGSSSTEYAKSPAEAPPPYASSWSSKGGPDF